MIGRIWHGWTTIGNADTYEKLLRSKILPEIHRIAGYKGAYLLRRNSHNSVEFITLTFFESMEAVRAFAGEDYEVAVVPPEARTLLSKFDERSVHFEVLMQPE
ncbi:MAG: antibiotic biosynthesis monooxygenase [Ignavibacteriales bacterium]|nr:antibiotic biosynthesis monooxygenase [Ignavibacteriales bacterium]